MGKTNAAIRERQRKIRRGEPLTALGLTFYPLTMSYYEEFLEVKNAWIIRLSTLPTQYMIMSFLSAIWAMEYDSITQTGKGIGFFDRIIHLLYLSLRLEYNREEALKKIYYNRQTPREISYIEITQNGNTVKITPQDFNAYIRPLVAEQNGLEIPDESFNPDILKAEQEYDQNNAPNLKFDLGNLISSVAYLSHISETELDNWTILQFERRYKAIERDKLFTLYKQAELSGMIKFKKGNPCPSWCYETQSISRALVAADSLTQNLEAVGDIKTALSKPVNPTPNKK